MGAALILAEISGVASAVVLAVGVIRWRAHRHVGNPSDGLRQPMVTVPRVARRETPVAIILQPARMVVRVRDADDSTGDLLTPIIIGPMVDQELRPMYEPEEISRAA